MIELNLSGNSAPGVEEPAPSAREGFWRWYFLGRERHPVRSMCATGACLAGVVAAWAFALRYPGLAPLRPLFEDPFTILSWAILIVSGIANKFMEFRLEQRDVLVDCEPSGRNREIARAYGGVYGTDLYLLLWKWRFLFFVSFLVALIRWF